MARQFLASLVLLAFATGQTATAEQQSQRFPDWTTEHEWHAEVHVFGSNTKRVAEETWTFARPDDDLTSDDNVRVSNDAPRYCTFHVCRNNGGRRIEEVLEFGKRTKTNEIRTTRIFCKCFENGSCFVLVHGLCRITNDEEALSHTIEFVFADIGNDPPKALDDKSVAMRAVLTLQRNSKSTGMQ